VSFDRYSGFRARWSQELMTMKNADHGDLRFYYSGMAQAMLLDRFAPAGRTEPLPLQRMSGWSRFCNRRWRVR
jgi:hypothetical protein